MLQQVAHDRRHREDTLALGGRLVDDVLDILDEVEDEDGAAHCLGLRSARTAAVVAREPS